MLLTQRLALIGVGGNGGGECIENSVFQRRCVGSERRLHGGINIRILEVLQSKLTGASATKASAKALVPLLRFWRSC